MGKIVRMPESTNGFPFVRTNMTTFEMATESQNLPVVIELADPMPFWHDALMAPQILLMLKNSFKRLFP